MKKRDHQMVHANQNHLGVSVPKEQDSMRILIDLLKLLINPSTDSLTLINYIEKYRVDINTYLPSIQGDMQIPLIYYCCSNANLDQLFMYLINHNVNLHVPIIADNPQQQIELLYYSQTKFIPTLIKHGCVLDPQNVPSSAEKLLIKGNINKLITLYKHGAIKKEQLLDITHQQGLIFRILDHLYERIYILCQQVADEGKLTAMVDELMKNYGNVFKLFFKNGINVNQLENGESFIQRVLNTYFIDIIRLVVEYEANFDNVTFLHYSNFELTNRQVMKMFYNEEKYQQIYDFLKDKIVPQKIVVKKPLIRKKMSK